MSLFGSAAFTASSAYDAVGAGTAAANASTNKFPAASAAYSGTNQFAASLNGQPFNLGADTNLAQTAIQTFYPTSNIVGFMNMTNLHSQLVTNQSFTMAVPTGVNVAGYNYADTFITNKLGSLITITSPESWHVEGTPNCTNVTKLFVEIYGGFTNALYWPLW